MKTSRNDLFEKKSQELKSIKDKALDKIKEQSGSLEGLKDKIIDKIGQEAGELKDKAGKTREKIKLESIIPDIRQIIFNKVAPKLKKENLSHLATEQIYKEVFKTTYTFLPAPLRLIIDEDTFVGFCLNNKTSLLADKLPGDENVTDKNQETKQALKGLLEAGILSQQEYDEKMEKLIKG
jgi:hypothetical protein